VVWTLPSPNPVNQYDSECHTSSDCVDVCIRKGFEDGGICSDYDKKCICNEPGDDDDEFDPSNYDYWMQHPVGVQ